MDDIYWASLLRSKLLLIPNQQNKKRSQKTTNEPKHFHYHFFFPFFVKHPRHRFAAATGANRVAGSALQCALTWTQLSAPQTIRSHIVDSKKMKGNGGKQQRQTRAWLRRTVALSTRNFPQAQVRPLVSWPGTNLNNNVLTRSWRVATRLNHNQKYTCIYFTGYLE